MRHAPPNEFHATPERSTKADSAAAVARRLTDRFNPAEQARTDALQHGDDPQALASHFRDAVSLSRREECARIRTDVLAIIAENTHAAGALAITVDPAEVDRVANDAVTDFDRIEVERERDADRVIGIWQHAKTAFAAWCDKSGGKRRQSPSAGLPKTCAIIAIAGVAEMLATAQLMDGQAVAGAPTPSELGLLFAATSIGWGVAGAFGSSLAADRRMFRHRLGIGIVVVTVLGWALTATLAAHMRLCLEAGGTGSVDEILASLDRGVLRAFASPMTIILAVASGCATAVAWFEVLAFIGRPLGARAQHAELEWANAQLETAERAQRAEISGTATALVQRIETFGALAWQPANDGNRLEREVSLALAQAGECFEALDRISTEIVSRYATTFRRLRPGIDVSGSVALEPMERETLGNPVSLHARIETLTRSAGAVAATVGEARTRIRTMEITYLRRAETRFAPTRRERPGAACTDVQVR